MKKITALMLALLLAVALIGCGSGEEQATTDETVTVSLPRELLGGQSDDEIVANAQEEKMEARIEETDAGIRVVYTMSKETQDALLLAYKTHFEEMLAQNMQDGSLPGVEDVSYADDMTSFDVLVDRDVYEQNINQIDMNLFFVTGTTYQFYAGGEEDEINVVVRIRDKNGEDIIDELNMRDSVASQQAVGED